ncbi:hypothetical protein ACHAXT_008449 [Thalassiosira profunda]
MMVGEARPSKPINGGTHSANTTSGGGASPGDVISLDDEGGADPEILAVTDIICLDGDEGESNSAEGGLADISNLSALDGHAEEEATDSPSQPSSSESNSEGINQSQDESAADGVAVCQSTQPGGESTARNNKSAEGWDGCVRGCAPKYPVCCPVWRNVQYSKPCSKYLLSEKGVVKSASLDRRTGKFVYEVENGHRSSDVAEKDLAFAARCPVYVKTEDGGKPEVEGEVLLVKPASGNHSILYTVMLSTGDAIKVEEGVAPDRLRYRVQLQTLQSRLRNTRAASKCQKGFGIRTNKEGKPVQNASGPIVRMKAAKRKRASTTYAEEDSDGSSDLDDSDDAESEENVSPKPTKKKRSSSGYTGVRWVKNARRFETRFCLNNKQHTLGYYDCGADAALAYDECSKLLRKTKTKFNFCSKQAYEDALREEMKTKGRHADVAASYAKVLAKVKAKVAKISGENGHSHKSKDEAADERTNVCAPGNNDAISLPPSSAEDDDQSAADSEDESYVDDSECSAEEELPQPAPLNPSKRPGTYTGVCWKKRDNCYQSQIWFANTTQCLGCFKHAADAALAYDECAKLLRKENTKFNFPDRQAYEAAIQEEMETAGRSACVDVAASAAAVLAKVKAKAAKITEQTGPNAQSDALEDEKDASCSIASIDIFRGIASAGWIKS